MKLIVLAAGDSFELDGFNKLLIKNPVTKKTILEDYVTLFDFDKITIVVGYKAMDVMNRYPEFDYVYNKKWQTTGSAYSLSLALTEEPCIVIESDFFIDTKVQNKLNSEDNYVVVKESESRNVTSFNAIVEGSHVKSVYSGKSSGGEPELLGMFKVSSPETLRQWKKNGIVNPHQYIGQSFPYDSIVINALVVEDMDMVEINTPNDFINFTKKNND